MFHKNFKLAITILILAVSIWEFTQGHIGNGIMYILLSSIFVFLYFKNELILLAFLKLRKQDFVGAKSWLDRIKHPEGALVPKQQGYYYYLNGLMISQTNMNEAEKYFRKAEKLGLSMSADMAMVKLNIAGIAMSKQRKREAEGILAEAKKLDKHQMMTDQIKMMQEQMKKSGGPRQQFSRGGRSGRGR